MSITLGATAAEVPGAAWSGLFYGAVGLGLAWAAGVFRRGSVRGPARLADRDDTAAAGVVGAAAFAAFYGAQIFLLAIAAGALPEALRANLADHLTARQFAELSIYPFAAGIAVLVVGDVATGRPLVTRLGYGPRAFPEGLAKGFVGFVVVMPLMIALLVALEAAYRVAGYEHPRAHQLLKAMDDASPTVRRALAFGAIALAPLYEEIFFRGHLQSVLRRATRSPWAAIFLTSFAFAVIHEPWTAPAIFLLSVGLGYAYERTGNLWVPIFIHAMFNAANTLQYLIVGTGR